MDDQQIAKILQENNHLGFVKRVLNLDNYEPLDNGDGTISTHSMSAEVTENGEWRVFPTVLMTSTGKLKRFHFRDAQRIADETGNYVSFGKDKNAAIDFSKTYKRAWEPDFLKRKVK